jgi:transcription elongation GreA/GreB family factor
VQEFEKLKNYIQELLDSDEIKKTAEKSVVIEHDFTPEEKDDGPEDLFEAAEQGSVSRGNVVELYDNVTYFIVKDDGKKEKRSVQIVPTHGNPDSGTIAQHSAIGRALLGCQKNEETEAILPIGEVTLQVVNIDKYKV